MQNWKKFGNSEYDAPGPNVATTTVSDDVYMTFISSKEVRILKSYDDNDPLDDMLQISTMTNILFYVLLFLLSTVISTRVGNVKFQKASI